LASAAANRDNAVIQYNRTYSLYSQGFSAAQDVDNAKAQARVQEAAVGAAQGALTNAVGARDTALGERKAAQEQLRITIAKSAADVETARQSLSQAQEALRLAKANRAQSPAYRQGLAALQATVQDAREALAAAVARQADTVLASPLDGFVTQRLVDPGTTVTSGQTLLMLEAFGDIWVTFAVPAEVATVLRKGQEVQAAFASLLGRVLPARIGQINPSAESQGRQFTVRAIMDNRQGLLKPGMFARVTATTAMAPRAVSVPPEALRTTRTGPTVIVVDTANVAHVRPVQTGLANGNYLAITSGLQPGEQVIVLGGERVRDGQRVAPQRRQPGQQPAPAASVTTTRTY
jgi:membrane fusion protein (multidrug efflux system)